MEAIQISAPSIAPSPMREPSPVHLSDSHSANQASSMGFPKERYQWLQQRESAFLDHKSRGQKLGTTLGASSHESLDYEEGTYR
jgi:hypothetical protein